MTPAEKKARNEALEEAAEVCDAVVQGGFNQELREPWGWREVSGMEICGGFLADRIRALKDEK